MSSPVVTIRFSEHKRHTHAILHGEWLPQAITVVVPLSQMTPEERTAVVPLIEKTITADFLPQTNAEWVQLASFATKPPATPAPSYARLLALEDSQFIAHMVEADFQLPEGDPADPLFQAYQNRWVALEEKARCRAPQLPSETQRVEHLEWARAHGTRRLQLAIEGGYDYLALYEHEFVTRLHPKVVLDAYRSAQVAEPGCPQLPSLEQIATLQPHFPDWQMRVVWLKAPPQPFEMDKNLWRKRCEAWQPQEAVQISIPGISSPAYLYVKPHRSSPAEVQMTDYK